MFHDRLQKEAQFDISVVSEQIFMAVISFSNVGVSSHAPQDVSVCIIMFLQVNRNHQMSSTIFTSIKTVSEIHENVAYYQLVLNNNCLL